MLRTSQLEKICGIKDKRFVECEDHDELLLGLYTEFEKLLDSLKIDEVSRILATLNNWVLRKKDMDLCEVNLGLYNPGDIVMCDYGLGFYDEVGYYHAGLILSKWDRKYLIVPITSSATIFNSAAVYKDNKYIIVPSGHAVNGKLTPNSTLVLSDMKWVSSSRLFKTIGSMDVESEFFKHIKDTAIEMLRN